MLASRSRIQLALTTSTGSPECRTTVSVTLPKHPTFHTRFHVPS